LSWYWFSASDLLDDPSRLFAGPASGYIGISSLRIFGLQLDVSYDEPQVLAAYLWRNYATLFEPSDRIVMKALIGEAKASLVDSPTYAERLRELFGTIRTAAVAAQLADGESEFQRRACAKLLASHAKEVIVNCCPSCSRIVRTPRARQCLWCGHDWHSA
jgi:hypothetical protein